MHRFEVGSAIAIAVGTATWGFLLWQRLAALGVPQRCINNWLIDGHSVRPECATQMQSWSAIAGGSMDSFFMAMVVAPVLAGLLAGTPIVAREIETGTSQTAWWLFRSRTSWLTRQLLPIAGLFASAIILLALSSEAYETLIRSWGLSAYLYIGLHGPLVILRAAAAFGVGLLAGTLVGRTMPAFILAGAVMAGIMIGVLFLRDTWVKSLEPTVIGVEAPHTTEMVVEPRAETTGWAWRAPDGTIGNQELPGYAPVILGVSEERALGWESYELALFGALTLVSLVGAGVATRRRRPL
jgi:hypothetical protein